MKSGFVLRSQRVATPSGMRPASVWIHEGRIERVAAPDEVPAGAPVEDFGDLVVMAGIVDTHVHVNEPGRTEWEGYATATRAAAAGGVTALVDMPLNSIPPTCTVEALQIKRKSADGRCHVDVGFWGGAIPGNLADLRGLHDEGVFGFKC